MATRVAEFSNSTIRAVGDPDVIITGILIRRPVSGNTRPYLFLGNENITAAVTWRCVGDDLAVVTKFPVGMYSGCFLKHDVDNAVLEGFSGLYTYEEADRMRPCRIVTSVPITFGRTAVFNLRDGAAGLEYTVFPADPEE